MAQGGLSPFGTFKQIILKKNIKIFFSANKQIQTKQSELVEIVLVMKANSTTFVWLSKY